jgi:hypothetical protein
MRSGHKESAAIVSFRVGWRHLNLAWMFHIHERAPVFQAILDSTLTEIATSDLGASPPRESPGKRKSDQHEPAGA